MTVETLNNFGVFTGAGQVERQAKQPVQKFRYSIELISFGGINGGKNVTLETNTCTTPKWSQDETKINTGNSEVKIAGKIHWGDFSFEVKDPIDGSVKKEISAQLSSQASPLTTAVATVATNYKFETKIHEHDGQGGILLTYDIVGCWLKEVDYGGYDYGSSDAKNISCTCSCDNCVIYDSEGNPINLTVESSMLNNLLSTGGYTGV